MRIKPHLGPLKRVEGRIPHPQGEIKVKLERRGNYGISAEITLPKGVTGTFYWNDNVQPLFGGYQGLEY